MPAFISYSQKDEAAYTSLCLALEGQRIEYWDPKSMMVGTSLRDQLREGIRRCDVCIFLATRNSVASKWCSAEIGAFWGASINVIIFIADSDLTEDQVPPQFQGDLWTRDIRQVVRVAKTEIDAASEKRKAEMVNRPRLVSEMTVDAFYDMLTYLRSNESRALNETMILLREAFLDNLADAKAYAQPLLDNLIDVPIDAVQSSGKTYWHYSFSLITDTGEWSGFAKEAIRATSADGYMKCLLIHTDSKSCDAAVAVKSVWEQNDTFRHGDILASAGAIAIGQIKKLVW